ncbi:MAG: hypothetical protein LBE27_03020 [Deltaproteobacteria bacterium]|nr:hypothetical protein [Deltaproteobacteria bacterium]
MKNSGLESFIRIEIRSDKANPTEYAVFCPRIKGESGEDIIAQKDIWLGKILNKLKGVYYSRERGVFGFTLESGFYTLPPEEIKKYEESLAKKKPEKEKSPRRAKSSIGFGDIYALDQFMRKNGLVDLFSSISGLPFDTLMSLVIFKILTDRATCNVQTWWNETAAKYLYPKALISPDQVGQFLENIGGEQIFSKYIKKHIDYAQDLTPKHYILMDSSDLFFDFDIPGEALINPHGKIYDTKRFIFVIDSQTRFPVYFSLIHGSRDDVSVLNNVLDELDFYGIKSGKIIVNALEYSEDNLGELYKNNILFLKKITDRKFLNSDHLIDQYEPNIKQKENYVEYGNKGFFIKKVPVSIHNDQIKGFAYVCKDLDEERLDEERYNYLNQEKHINDSQYQKDRKMFGSFVLLSSTNLQIDEVLSCYYAYESLDLFSGLFKNEIRYLAKMARPTLAFKGIQLISFMALTAFTSFKNALESKNLSFDAAVFDLRRYQALLYSHKLVPYEKSKRIENIYKALNVKIPEEIKLNNYKKRNT